MRTLQLIQIGDIHYPQCRNKKAEDIKDSGFPYQVRELIAQPLIQVSIREILRQCERDVNGILLCGDLTSYGDLDGYKDCVKYLHNSLLNKSEYFRYINVVPGNHDVNHKLCDPVGEDIFRKFEPLVTAWRQIGIEALPIQGFREVKIPSPDNCALRIFSLNSCIGCGEERHLPEEIRSNFKNLLDEYEKNVDTDQAFELIGEKLDTPAFLQTDIENMCAEITANGRRVMTIVVAHHNILPQALPRIAIYTEVINGGLVRSRFSRLGQPVIYCHGHIHSDPIEIVTLPGEISSRVICISAPELTEGFNLIKIEFGEKEFPLGCIVTPYRINKDCSIYGQTDIRIPLAAIREAEDLGHHRLVEFLSGISRDPKRFKDVISDVRGHVGVQIQESTLSNVLLEAEWFGLVEIINREDDCKHWQVRKLP